MRKIGFLLATLVVFSALLMAPVLAESVTTSESQAAQVTCAGSPPTRMIGAQRGQVAQRFSTLRAAIGSDHVLAIMPGGATFNVVSGPVCGGFGSFTWYQVNYNGLVGWVTEGAVYSIWGNNQYWIAPLDRGGATLTPTVGPTSTATSTARPPSATPTVWPTSAAACPGAPAPKLVVGGRARVAQSYSSLRAGIQSDRILRIMRPTDTIEVLAGPFCSFGPYNWWQVRSANVIGYATEGTGGAYWLVPAS
jgi:hypothetical protein